MLAAQCGSFTQSVKAAKWVSRQVYKGEYSGAHNQPTSLRQRGLIGQRQFSRLLPEAQGDAKDATCSVHTNWLRIASALCLAEALQAVFRNGFVRDWASRAGGREREAV